MRSNLYDQISAFYDQPSVVINSSFANLSSANFDLGYRSLIINGQEKHLITRNISLSVQHIKDAKMQNLLFSNSMPLLLELQDTSFNLFSNDFIEIRYIFDGELSVEFEDQTLKLQKDDICLISPNSLHRELVGCSEALYLNIDIDKDIFNESMIQSIALNPLQRFLRSTIIAKTGTRSFMVFKPDTESASSNVSHYLRNIFREAKDQRAGYLDIFKGYLIRLMDELASSYHGNFSDSEKKIYREKLFQSISVYISEHISSIKVDDLSGEFHYSPNFFNILIKEKTGKTYSDYLIELRINRAKLLLEKTDMPIEQIAMLVGYNNKGFFYRKFVELVGLNPAKYRTVNAKIQ